jgi:hypothetical protein
MNPVMVRSRFPHKIESALVDGLTCSGGKTKGDLCRRALIRTPTLGPCFASWPTGKPEEMGLEPQSSHRESFDLR